MFNLIPWKKKTKDNGKNLASYKGQPLAQLRDEFDTLFDRLLSRWSFPWPEVMDHRLGLDLDEREDEVVVRAEVPGFEPEELDVQVSGQLLTIKGEQKHEEKKGKNGYQEQRYRSYFQTVQLPAGTKSDQVEAKYRNGVLELHIPRDEKARPKRIPVKA